MRHSFFHRSNEIRVILDENKKPWFVAKDVAEVLGYKNTRDAISKHCKGGRDLRLPSEGGEQVTKIINQADVVRLATRSKLPAAVKFESWIFDWSRDALISTTTELDPINSENLSNQNP